MKIVWKKEMKNCVPFYVFMDGKEYGVIKHGETIEINCNKQTAELHFIPKAPRFFGWKALKLNVKLYGNTPEIYLGILTSIVAESQLHCIRLIDVEVTAMEYIKKYKDLLDNLHSKPLHSIEEALPKQPEPQFKLGDGYYFEFDEIPNGMGGYRMINVYLLKIDEPSFRRCIVNGDGNIENFPGIEEGEWIKELEFSLNNKTQFRFWIHAYKDGKASVEWTLQPDGRYFADEDGFGAENCEEITLHSYLDTNGAFTEPFKYQ